MDEIKVDDVVIKSHNSGLTISDGSKQAAQYCPRFE